jgi:exosome complex RNA-binding protein Rrp4
LTLASSQGEGSRGILMELLVRHVELCTSDTRYPGRDGDVVLSTVGSREIHPGGSWQVLIIAESIHFYHLKSNLWNQSGRAAGQMQETSNNGSSIVNIVEHDTKDGSLSRICLRGLSVARSGSGPLTPSGNMLRDHRFIMTSRCQPWMLFSMSLSSYTRWSLD